MNGSATLRVLVVDDERVIADTLALIVQSEGHAVRTAYSGEQATQLASDLKPDAAISDVMMPGMTGFELAAWLEENHPQCRVLLISGHADNLEELTRRGIRARCVLLKPVHPREILSFLATCINSDGDLGSATPLT